MLLGHFANGQLQQMVNVEEGSAVIQDQRTADIKEKEFAKSQTRRFVSGDFIKQNWINCVQRGYAVRAENANILHQKNVLFLPKNLKNGFL